MLHYIIHIIYIITIMFTKSQVLHMATLGFEIRLIYALSYW